jgi:NadR type nicotinamide-nucleotide adenylyltransferase
VGAGGRRISHVAKIARICLTGPECTGKSRLARRLATALGTVSVAEYAREYAEARGNRLSADDVEPIARGQMANEDRGADEATGILVLDTDLISTVVYARHYYGVCPVWIEEEARRRRADLYLLMDTDLEWKADSARDAAGDAREDLFDAFRSALEEFETEWEIVSGAWEDRWQRLLQAVQKKWAAGWG